MKFADIKKVNRLEQYLTIAELAERLSLRPKTIQNKMASGAFQLGVHYFRPPGMQARFKWSAVVTWMEQKPPDQTPHRDGIPMVRGYLLE